MSRIYVYEINPIDDWTGWMSEEEYFSSAKSQCDPHYFDEISTMAKIKATTGKAEYLAKKLGWEGDFTVGPLYSAIPSLSGNSQSEMLIGWKQSNDGTTYIASPYSLSWLERDARMIAE